MSSRSSLSRGERVRPIAITLLDPIVSIIAVGSIFWRLSTTDAGHAFFAILGGVAGVVIGWLRARVMFVRAMPESHNVVLRRSSAEYGLLALLILVRLSESSLTHGSGVGSLLLSAFVSLGIVEAVSRSTFVVMAYRRASGAAPDVEGESTGSAPT